MIKITNWLFKSFFVFWFQMVCYDKNSRSSSRQVIFRLQFHTGLVHGHTLTFLKADLDCASAGTIYNLLFSLLSLFICNQ